jgi:hypothetical protein
VSTQYYNIATLLGTALSLVGLVVAIVQVRKAVTAAQAAETAAAATENAIARNMFLADVSTCVTGIEELKLLIRTARHEAALLRVTDLNANLIQLQHLPKAPADTSSIRLKEILTQLVILRDVLEQKVHASETEISPVQANTVLSNISDQLNHWVASARFDRARGERHS